MSATAEKGLLEITACELRMDVVDMISCSDIRSGIEDVAAHFR